MWVDRRSPGVIRRTCRAAAILMVAKCVLAQDANEPPPDDEIATALKRADDLANFLPARLTYLLICLAAFLTGQRGGAALWTGWRDGPKHPSPNAGWPEAAMAGALSVQLGGPSTYAGIPTEKPRLGVPQQPLTARKVSQALRLMIASAWLALCLSLVARGAIIACRARTTSELEIARASTTATNTPQE